MRTTEINKDGKTIKKSKILDSCICSLSPEMVVLILTVFERKGGET